MNIEQKYEKLKQINISLEGELSQTQKELRIIKLCLDQRGDLLMTLRDDNDELRLSHKTITNILNEVQNENYELRKEIGDLTHQLRIYKNLGELG